MNQHPEFLAFFALHYGFFCLFGIASYSIGQMFVFRLQFHSVWERIATCTALGLGIIGNIVMVLAFARLLYAPVIVGVIGVLCAISAVFWIKPLRQLFSHVGRPQDGPS
jgi:hypothetical protein